MMIPKSKTFVLGVLAVFFALTTVFIFISGGSERTKRMQKEKELIEKQEALVLMEAKIAQTSQDLANYRESSQKRINALEMAAREREESARALKEQVETITKEKEAAIHDALEKSSAVAELTDRLAALQKEKEDLGKAVEDLKKNITDLTAQLQIAKSAQVKAATTSASPSRGASNLSEPYGIAPTKDLGGKIDPVNLGQIVLSKGSGRSARVQEVNSVYDFIVVDVGSNDGIREGAILNVVRQNLLIGKAVVRHVRAGASAAILMPDWKRVPIEKGDLITQF